MVCGQNICYSVAIFCDSLQFDMQHDGIDHQARSQAEAMKPGLQHHMGIDTRNPEFS